MLAFRDYLILFYIRGNDDETRSVAWRPDPVLRTAGDKACVLYSVSETGSVAGIIYSMGCSSIYSDVYSCPFF